MESLFDNYWEFLKKRTEFSSCTRPVLRWHFSEQLNELEMRYFNFLKNSKLVLDYGAGDQSLKRKFLKNNFIGQYKTCDISKNYQYDFQSLDAVIASGLKFDAVLLLEVIEHMSLQEFAVFLPKLLSILNPKGKLIISTPNAHSINAVWATDFTHVKSYPLPDLWAMLSLRGFKCQPFRVILTNSSNGVIAKIIAMIRLFIAKILTNLLGVDYATGVAMLCERQS
ncbi:MAG: methyltransferase domain-containing protein [Deltaproteobacteria bacterium]|nr:methyltransferase domain-containing protein [Deltaproteobacteria bacterium]